MNTLERFGLEEELRILKTHRHARGAWAVLHVLENAKRKARGREADEWVDIDTISAITGQRAIHSRIAELRADGKFMIEHNGRAGGKSKYRLIG